MFPRSSGTSRYTSKAESTFISLEKVARISEETYIQDYAYPQKFPSQ